MDDATLEDARAYLEHYGVKGMKWGVRRDRPSGVSRKVDKMAKKDAKEMARAKAFYGEGAGTRRKLIKQKTGHRAQTVEGYKKALDYHSAKQDISKHVDKAISERKRKDRIKTTKRYGSATARQITGQMGTAAAVTALTYGAYHSNPQVKAKVDYTIKTIINKVKKL